MLHRWVFGPASVVISCSLLVGCATQEVLFTSVPPGATVFAGRKTGTTPCILRVRDDVDHATFRLSSGAEMTRPIDFDSDWVEGRDRVRIVTGGSLMVVGGVVFVAGLGLLILAESGNTDNDYERDAADNDLWQDIGLATIGGGLIFGLGGWIYPERTEPVVHAQFTGFPDEELYEDPGYGAIRLKRDTP